jgi:hypothetical protein
MNDKNAGDTRQSVEGRATPLQKLSGKAKY